MKNLDGKIAFVSGSSRGLGKAIAYELATQGATLLLHASKPSKEAQNTLKEIISISSLSKLYFSYIENPTDVEVMEKKIAQDFDHIDILVNNAGITQSSSFAKMTNYEWKTVIDVNINGTFYVTKTLTPLLIKKRGGRIIQMSSTYALNPEFGQANYSTSKAALIGFTKALALEFAKYKITVNAVCPGITDVGMIQDIPIRYLAQRIEKIPLRRIGKKEEVAKLISFLCSDDANYITGQAININGGMH